jgi:hypothetical protein
MIMWHKATNSRKRTNRKMNKDRRTNIEGNRNMTNKEGKKTTGFIIVCARTLYKIFHIRLTLSYLRNEAV